MDAQRNQGSDQKQPKPDEEEKKTEQNGKGKKKEPPKKTRKLSLRRSIAKKEGVWLATVIATLKKGKDSHKGVPVQFSLDQEEDGKPVRTDESGNAIKEFNSLKSGEHTVLARIGKEGPSAMVDIVIKDEKKPPAKLVVSVTGNDRRRVVTVQVLDPDNKPVTGSIVRAESERISGGFVDLKPTDKNGTAMLGATLKANEAVVNFSVLGTPLRESRSFFAPQPQP